MTRPIDHTTTRETPIITRISHTLATIWVAREKNKEACYFYGGTRLIDASTSDATAEDALLRLMTNESGTKNRLINWAIADGSLNDIKAELPPGFLESRVAGARCLIRPRTPEIASQLSDPRHRDYRRAAISLLKRVAEILNQQESLIKLTPDFGRHAGLADLLHEYTPNVLGIRCESGGCGGKSSYSTTGVLAAVEYVLRSDTAESPVTCIGSAGAMGSGVLEHFRRQSTFDLGACDLAYDVDGGQRVLAGCRHLKSMAGQFTAESLLRGGLIVATTVGDELANSPWEKIPSGTALLLAHNLALPAGDPAVELARALARRNVLVIPGQVLTLGGALTARLEWYWRQLPSKPLFNKRLAHEVVRRVVSHLIRTILAHSIPDASTPYEAMVHLASQETAA